MQLTLVALGVVVGWAAFNAFSAWRHPASFATIELDGAQVAGFGQVALLAACAAVCLAGAIWMGGRPIRGPVPPSLDP